MCFVCLVLFGSLLVRRELVEEWWCMVWVVLLLFCLLICFGVEDGGSIVKVCFVLFFFFERNVFKEKVFNVVCFVY